MLRPSWKGTSIFLTAFLVFHLANLVFAYLLAQVSEFELGVGLPFRFYTTTCGFAIIPSLCQTGWKLKNLILDLVVWYFAVVLIKYRMLSARPS